MPWKYRRVERKCPAGFPERMVTTVAFSRPIRKAGFASERFRNAELSAQSIGCIDDLRLS
jgi:hypothetical protein